MNAILSNMGTATDTADRHNRTGLAATVAITVATICLLVEVGLRVSNVSANAREAIMTEPTSFQYIGKFHPTRPKSKDQKYPVYTAGESVYFNSIRRVKFDDGRTLMPILVTSSFQNIDNGLTYGLAPIAHVLDKAGETEKMVVRRLPEDIQPGRYVLVGWAKSETEKRPAFATFQSDEFEVFTPQK